jgi:hypothetical protein
VRTSSSKAAVTLNCPHIFNAIPFPYKSTSIFKFGTQLDSFIYLLSKSSYFDFVFVMLIFLCLKLIAPLNVQTS